MKDKNEFKEVEIPTLNDFYFLYYYTSMPIFSHDGNNGSLPIIEVGVLKKGKEDER